jgi:tRNA dimethylallyltransferase
MKIPPRTVIALVGPTASGKTPVSLSLAKRIPLEIISADSRQFYRGLDIGTAKPSAEELAAAPHHFIDILSPAENYSAGAFGEEGRRSIEEIFSRGHIPIVVGGSGLYVRSLLDGLFEGPGADPDLRAMLEQRLHAGGIDGLVEQLRALDPDSAARIDPTKPRRIIRALEVCITTGKPMSRLHAEQKPELRFATLRVGLLWERKALYARIERRCDEMLAHGLLDEIDALRAKGYDRRMNALNTVGYAEGFSFRDGEISREEMVRLFKQNTRRYAKRQMTWFRADEQIRWIEVREPFDPERIADEIVR